MKKVWTVVVAAWSLIAVLGAAVVFFVPLGDVMIIRADCGLSAVPKRDIPLAKKRLIEEIETLLKTAGIAGTPKFEFQRIPIGNRKEIWSLNIAFKSTIAQELLERNGVCGRIIDDAIKNVSEIYAKQESIAIPSAE